MYFCTPYRKMRLKFGADLALTACRGGRQACRAMMAFLTDILVLPTAFIGVLTTFARIFDAFTDIFMGVIADRTKSKWGRFRPWILRAGPV